MSDTSNPARIERDLDQTRSRLGSHLSELQDKLSPGQVLDDLMGYFRGSEGAAFGQSLLQNVRGNPMPAAITAIGLAWLMASKNTASAAAPVQAVDWDKFDASGPHVYGRDDYGATMARVQEAEKTVLRGPSESEHTHLARLDEVRGQAMGLARHAQETAESFGQRVQDAWGAVQSAVAGSAQGVRNQVGSAVSAVGTAAGSVGTSAQVLANDAMRSLSGTLSQGGQAGGNLVTALTESPVLLGALGLAAGALLGALLPKADGEEAALGGLAGQARDAATGFAKEGLEKGKQVAQAVMDKGRDSAQSRGLTGDKSAGELVDAALSGNLAGDTKAVVQDVLRTGEDAIQKAVAPGQPGKPA